MRRNLLLPSLVGGILLAEQLPPGLWQVLFLPPLVAMVGLALRQRSGARLLPAAFFTSLGLALTYLALHGSPFTFRIDQLAGPDQVRLQGSICQQVGRSDGSLQLDLGELAVLRPEGVRSCAGRLRLSVAQATEDWGPGDRLQLTTRLRHPAGYGLPGELDRGRQLAAQGVLVTGHLASDRELLRLSASRPGGWTRHLTAARTQAAGALAASLPARRASILRALLLGDRGALDEADRQLLARAGIAHLFSISGLHLGLLSALLYLLLEAVYKCSRYLLNWQPPGRVLPLLIVPPLWGYVQFTGAGYPVQRAFLMLAGGTLLYLWQRSTRPFYLLQGALLLVLLLQPLALFSPALQLSVAGLGGILILVPRWQPRLEPLPIWLRVPSTALLVTLAGTLATLPLVWQYFHLLSTAGPLVNLLAVPVVGFLALPSGLLGLLLAPFCPDLASGLFQVSGWLAELILDFSRWLVQWPGFGGVTSYPDPLQLAGVWLLVAAVCCWNSATRGGRRRVLVPLVGGLALLLFPYPQPATARVTALSVGQGEALLLSFAGRNYLLDGGGDYQQRFDVGTRLVAPALGYLGVHRLDGVILSHDHPDHRLGLLPVLKQVPVTAFFSAVPPDELDRDLAMVLEQQHEIRHVRLPEGWSEIAAAAGWQLQVWAPPQHAPDVNDRSLVTLLHDGSQGALLTGDLASAGLARLARTPVPGPVSLLKLPHHGSRYADPAPLLERWHPPLAFVSAGRDNRFGFPHQEVCATCERLGAKLLRTDLDGTLQFTAEPSGWQSKTFCDRLFR